MKVIAKPIQMIAWFTEEGTPKPIRFRICNEDDTYSVIKIDRIICSNLEKLAGNPMLIFKCQSIIKGVERVYELKYELNSCKWILFKM
ncbi:MAG: hypothetical protein Q8936_07955 [Bacillota bacterium]|nr:hypothetical protein [Bacillota bacterium]